MTPHSQVQILLEQFDMKTGNFIRDLVKQGLEIRKMLYGELNGDDRGPQNGCLVEPASNFNHILPYSLISERPGLCRTFSAAAHGGRKRQARTASELRKSLQQACRHCVEASHAAQGRINRPTPVFGRPPAAHRVRRPRWRRPRRRAPPSHCDERPRRPSISLERRPRQGAAAARETRRPATPPRHRPAAPPAEPLQAPTRRLVLLRDRPPPTSRPDSDGIKTAT